MDVTNPEGVEKAVIEQIKEFNDRLDIFVYNSGAGWTSGAAITGSLDNYHSVMKVNVDGLFYCARVAGRIFREQKQKNLEGFRAGSFIATSSMSGHIANFPQLQAAYNSSKAAVKHLCQSLVGPAACLIAMLTYTFVHRPSSGCNSHASTPSVLATSRLSSPTLFPAKPRRFGDR